MLHFRVAQTAVDWLFVEQHFEEIEQGSDLTRGWLREKAADDQIAVVLAEELPGAPIGWMALCCTAELLYISALYFLPNTGWRHRRTVLDFLRTVASDAGGLRIGFEPSRRGWKRIFPGATAVAGTDKYTLEV